MFSTVLFAYYIVEVLFKPFNFTRNRVNKNYWGVLYINLTTDNHDNPYHCSLEKLDYSYVEYLKGSEIFNSNHTIEEAGDDYTSAFNKLFRNIVKRSPTKQIYCIIPDDFTEKVIMHQMNLLTYRPKIKFISLENISKLLIHPRDFKIALEEEDKSWFSSKIQPDYFNDYSLDNVNKLFQLEDLSTDQHRLKQVFRSLCKLLAKRVTIDEDVVSIYDKLVLEFSPECCTHITASNSQVHKTPKETEHPSQESDSSGEFVDSEEVAEVIRGETIKNKDSEGIEHSESDVTPIESKCNKFSISGTIREELLGEKELLPVKMSVRSMIVKDYLVNKIYKNPSYMINYLKTYKSLHLRSMKY